MSELARPQNNSTTRLLQRRAEVEAIRGHAKILFDGGATGIQVAAAISEATEQFICRLFEATLRGRRDDHATVIGRNVAIVAIGGTGRGELCPYSDVDLLFLVRPSAKPAAAECISEAVRDYWDAGLRLGHSVRTVADTLAMARQEVDVATALIESRLLWGDRALYGQLVAEFHKRIVRSRVAAFIDDCVAAREKERAECGSAVKQLEPDIKRSPGGLRDLHLMRWVGSARFGVAEVDALRMQGVLARDEARALLSAHEYLKRIRVDLHFAAGRCQDVLVRDEQLRIADERRIEGTVAQRPVERFMQAYFRHSTAIAELCERFITLHRPRSLFSGFLRSLATHRSDGIYIVGNGMIDVPRRRRDAAVSSLERILAFYRAAALYRVAPSAEFCERIREAAPRLSGEFSPACGKLFLEILGCHGKLGAILRSMLRTGILEIVVPSMAHARCLLQFNQYHSYTVDEHTLRALEELERFEQDSGLLGEEYRAVRNKAVLHLALLLHDLGKGFNEDHSLVGRAIADRMADRLRMPDDDRETLVFLVHKHLVMAHRAFRRDTCDSDEVLDFSREVGSAQRLRTLFLLTAADLKGVGPEVWTGWKAQLLFELFARTRAVLSGPDSAPDDAARRELIKREVLEWDPASESHGPEAVARRAALLDRLPAHYLGTTPPERIASDLRLMGEHAPGRIVVDGRFDGGTQTVEYRILTHEDDVTGCFHKATGVLTAKRLEIVSAQITTSSDGFVIDRFRVHDHDFAGEVPGERIDEVATAMKNALSGRVAVEELFKRHRRFGGQNQPRPISNLPVRVVVDNGSSERFTVIDVFAHDRPGLLYTLSRKIFELDLSVVLAKIATHVDQVVDVFYVTDRAGQKLADATRLKEIQATLFATLDAFETTDRLQFVS